MARFINVYQGYKRGRPWRTRPLLCRLSLHRPYSCEDGLHRCYRCPYRWEPNRVSGAHIEDSDCEAR